MRTRSYTPILGIALIALLAASCSSDQVAPAPEGWLSATILGDESAAYRGTGHFQSTSELPGWPAEMPSIFFLYSAGTGSSTGEEFTLTGYDRERPGVGRYPLGASQGESYDWNLTYNVQRGDSIARYGVVDGEFEITASSNESIQGRFSITAVLGMVCSNEPVRRDEDGIPVLPCTFHTGPELSTVEINGSFNALPDLPCERTPPKTYSAWEAHPVMIFCVS
jgi:hypothetical protein